MMILTAVAVAGSAAMIFLTAFVMVEEWVRPARVDDEPVCELMAELADLDELDDVPIDVILARYR